MAARSRAPPPQGHPGQRRHREQHGRRRRGNVRRAPEHAERSFLADQPLTGHGELRRDDAPGLGDGVGLVLGVSEPCERAPGVARLVREDVDDGGQPQQGEQPDRRRHGQRQGPQGRGPAPPGPATRIVTRPRVAVRRGAVVCRYVVGGPVLRGPILRAPVVGGPVVGEGRHHLGHDAPGEEAEPDRHEPHVGLGEERRHDRGDGQRPPVAARHGPHEHHEQGERQRGDERVPVVGREPAAERAEQEGDRQQRAHEEGGAAPAAGQHGDPHHRGPVDGERPQRQPQARAAGDPVDGPQQVPQHRAGVAPVDPGEQPRQHLSAADVADRQLARGQVAGRMEPVGPDHEGHGRHDERHEDHPDQRPVAPRGPPWWSPGGVGALDGVGSGLGLVVVAGGRVGRRCRVTTCAGRLPGDARRDICALCAHRLRLRCAGGRRCSPATSRTVVRGGRRSCRRSTHPAAAGGRRRAGFSPGRAPRARGCRRGRSPRGSARARQRSAGATRAPRRARPGRSRSPPPPRRP